MDRINTYLILTLVFAGFVQSSPVNNGRSAIIDTAKQAYEAAVTRHKRSVSSPPTLEELLLKPEERRDEHLVEFDLILDDDQYTELLEVGEVADEHVRHKRKAVRHSIYHWPGAEVPYSISSSALNISPNAQYRIKKAMEHWERYTCVKFVEYQPFKHTNYVSIQAGQWCASKLGMSGGAQPLYLALGCLDTGTIIHELGHTLGWVHEQARPDRDNYVTIRWDLVSASYKSQYVKHDTTYINTYGVPYDYGSIMHYPSYGELITKDASAQRRIGQRVKLSFYDRKLANLMYQCSERSQCDVSQVKCTNDGYVDKNCNCVCKDGTSSCRISGAAETTPKPQGRTTPNTGTGCIWIKYDNSYIPRYNEDVGSGLTVEQCKARCERETRFTCRSFDYWRQRKQCYLSSKTAQEPSISFNHDYRMTHYQIINNCSHTKTTAPSVMTTIKSIVTGTGSTTISNRIVIPTVKPVAASCPFEYTSIGLQCVRALDFPLRPNHLAANECKSRLTADIWNMDDQALENPELKNSLQEGVEYWVNVPKYQSTNPLSRFFDFCPYLIKTGETVELKDSFCHKQKGFLCSKN